MTWTQDPAATRSVESGLSSHLSSSFSQFFFSSVRQSTEERDGKEPVSLTQFPLWSLLGCSCHSGKSYCPPGHGGSRSSSTGSVSTSMSLWASSLQSPLMQSPFPASTAHGAQQACACQPSPSLSNSWELHILLPSKRWECRLLSCRSLSAVCHLSPVTRSPI